MNHITSRSRTSIRMNQLINATFNGTVGKGSRLQDLFGHFRITVRISLGLNLSVYCKKPVT